MSKKHESDLYVQFIAVFLGTFITLGFWLFVSGMKFQNQFDVVAGGSIIFLSALSLFYSGKIARQMK